MAESENKTTGFDIATINSYFKKFVGRSDVYFASGIVAILIVLLMPIPTWTLDILLGISITMAVLILMTVLFIDRHLELSSFPTILLITTMLRLSLNIASTRLILAHGYEGPDAAGKVIEAFGSFVMQGSVVIGAIVFAILSIINFIVITKGSGRIAEVAARFSLDAMPGKQMAIDADLSAGLIDENAARARRKELEDESAFYGSMDGASKFVRGDAIAGILIIFINFIAGVLIGTVQQGMSFSDALNTYTLLTVGDGLVSQIPSLIVSTSAGLLVSKSGDKGSADKAVLGQLGKYPHALGMSSAVLTLMAILPGIPAIPFMTLAIIIGFFSWRSVHSQKKQEEEVAQQAAMETTQAEGVSEAQAAENEVANALHIDLMRLELGYGLLPLVNYQKGHRITEQIKALRRQLAREYGFIMPAVRIQDNMQLPANVYVIRVKEIDAGRGEIRPDMMLVMNPSGGDIELPGEQTTEPTFGLPAMWVSETHREDALFRNYTVVDPPTVVTTHLTEVIKDNMADMFSYGETKKLLDDMPEEYKKLVDDIIPSQITISGLQQILQNLLNERISIRDMPAIIEAVAEASRSGQNVIAMTEHVRSKLARQISHANTGDNGYIPIVTLSPEWEQTFAEAISGQQGDDRQLAMPPTKIQEFINTTRNILDNHAIQGVMPIILTSPLNRPYVRSIIERVRPSTVVLSQNEIYSKSKVKTFGQI
jgi:flagellar biosynthesis protein FlhA